MKKATKVFNKKAGKSEWNELDDKLVSGLIPHNAEVLKRMEKEGQNHPPVLKDKKSAIKYDQMCKDRLAGKR